MSSTELILAAALVAVIVLRKKPAQTVTDQAQNEYEVPKWGANWISDQWRAVQDGTAHATGTHSPGWPF